MMGELRNYTADIDPFTASCCRRCRAAQSHRPIMATSRTIVVHRARPHSYPHAALIISDSRKRTSRVADKMRGNTMITHSRQFRLTVIAILGLAMAASATPGAMAAGKGNQSGPSPGSKGTSHKVQMQDIHFVKSMDKSSPNLFPTTQTKSK